MQAVDAMVFRISGGWLVLEPCRGGVFISHVYSSKANALRCEFRGFVRLLRSLGYRQVWCRPLTAAHARLYRRFGFEVDSNDLLKLELKREDGREGHG